MFNYIKENMREFFEERKRSKEFKSLLDSFDDSIIRIKESIDKKVDKLDFKALIENNSSTSKRILRMNYINNLTYEFYKPFFLEVCKSTHLMKNLSMEEFEEIIYTIKEKVINSENDNQGALYYVRNSEVYQICEELNLNSKGKFKMFFFIFILQNSFIDEKSVLPLSIKSKLVTLCLPHLYYEVLYCFENKSDLIKCLNDIVSRGEISKKESNLWSQLIKGEIISSKKRFLNNENENKELYGNLGLLVSIIESNGNKLEGLEDFPIKESREYKEGVFFSSCDR